MIIDFIPLEGFNYTDGRGDLFIIAENKAERIHLINHFRLADTSTEEGARKFLELLDQEEPLSVRKSSVKRPWYNVNVVLELEYSEPYYKEYVKRTGDVGRGILPDIQLPPYKWQGLIYTCYIQRAWTEHGHICFDLILDSEDWNGLTAQAYAEKRAKDICEEAVGARQIEPEFIQRGHAYYPNPNRSKRHRPEPALAHDWVLRALLQDWFNNRATDAQRAAVRQSDDCFASIRSESPFWICRDAYEGGVRTSWEAPIIKWEDFIKL